MRRSAPSLSLLLAAVALGNVSTRADRSAAADAAPSPWVGVWTLHEPDHGSYVANELRFYADGRLWRSAMIDTNARAGRPMRALGIVVFGRKSCRLGERWRLHRSPERVLVDGVCSDGRARELTFALPRGSFERSVPAGTLRAERVGTRSARLGASFRQELVRCHPDPSARCHVFDQDPRTVRLEPPDGVPPSPDSH